MDVMHKRLLAIVIDFFLCLMIGTGVSLVVIFIGDGVITRWLSAHNVGDWAIYLPMVVLAIFKDISGKSVGKHATNIKIVCSNDNMSSPNVFKKILRNITIIILPVEVFMIMFGKTRIGDRIAKTKIIEQ